MITFDSSATQNFGKQIAQALKSGAVVALYGDLGAGKTTLAKGIISQLTNVSLDEIPSPTFTLLNIYDGECPVYHLDLYRLENTDAFIEKGFIDFLEGDGICLIEWPDRIATLLPHHTHHITLAHLSEGERRIDV